MLVYSRLKLISWMSALQTVYANSGLTLELDEEGLPPELPVSAFTDNVAAANALSSTVLTPLTQLPAPPTDWTKNTSYQSAASTDNITLAVTLLDSWQTADPDQRATPLVQYLYPQVLGLALSQAVELTYESVEQAMQLRSQLHAHIDYIQRQLFADQHSDALKMAYSGEVVSHLRDLMNTVDEAAEQQLATLPNVVSINLNSEQPLLAVAWSQHKDSSETDNILSRNSEISHPLFTPAEVTLELLK